MGDTFGVKVKWAEGKETEAVTAICPSHLSDRPLWPEQREEKVLP